MLAGVRDPLATTELAAPAMLLGVEDGSVVCESALLDWWAPPRDHQSEYSTGRRTATVTAASDSQVRTLVFEPRGFEALREEVPRVALRLMNEMSRRFRGDEPE